MGGIAYLVLVAVFVVALIVALPVWWSDDAHLLEDDDG